MFRSALALLFHLVVLMMLPARANTQSANQPDSHSFIHLCAIVFAFSKLFLVLQIIMHGFYGLHSTRLINVLPPPRRRAPPRPHRTHRQPQQMKFQSGKHGMDRESISGCINKMKTMSTAFSANMFRQRIMKCSWTRSIFFSHLPARSAGRRMTRNSNN